MKGLRILTVVLTLALVFAASGCGTIAVNGFFKQSVLKELHIDGLPAPDGFEFVTSSKIGRYVLGVIESEEAFHAYAQKVLDFLSDRFEYIGTAGEQLSSFFGGAADIVFLQKGNVLEDYLFSEQAYGEYGGSYHYIFVYIADEITDEVIERNEYAYTSLVVEVEFYKKTIYPETGELYNMMIKLKNGGMFDKYYYYPADLT